MKNLGTLSENDMAIVKIEASDWSWAHSRPKRQAGEMPADVLETWEFTIARPVKLIQERLFAWSSRLDVSGGLRWCDMSGASPKEISIQGECLIWIAEQA